MKRRQESGFALLMVFVMAAGVAVLLYQQLPRVAFESMRAKEEMLIERGEQYQRAIQLHLNKLKRYPQNIEDLEKAGGTRFLRRRFKDPFTGSDEWRLVHVNAVGQLTDSLVQKQTEGEKKNQNTFITEYAGIGQQSANSGQTGVNVALRRRPGDGTLEVDPNSPNFQTAAGGAVLPSPFAPSSGPNPADPNAASGPTPINPATGQPYPPGYSQLDPATGQPVQQNQTGINPATGQPWPQGQMQQTQTMINPATGQPYQPGQIAINPATGQPFQPVPTAINPATGQPYQPPINPATGQPYQPGQTMTLQQAYPNGVPQYPGQLNPGQPVTNQPFPNQPFGSAGNVNPQVPNTAFGNPGTSQPFGTQPFPLPGQMQGQMQAPVQGQMQGGYGSPAPTYPTGAAAQAGRPSTTTTSSNPALDMIRKALTSPSPNIPMNLAPGLALGPGIIGVASKYEGPSIKVYNEQEEYQKWEFLYDPKKDKRLLGAVAQSGMQAMGGQGNAPGTNRTQGPGQGWGGSQGVGAGSTSPFGSVPPSGIQPPSIGPPGIGQPGIGQPGFGQPGTGQPGIGSGRR